MAQVMEEATHTLVCTIIHWVCGHVSMTEGSAVAPSECPECHQSYPKEVVLKLDYRRD